MKPISLTLKGFRGIRKGLGQDVIELNFQQLVGDAQLVAIVGKNGRGKTTIMDNMTPYPVMPSHAGADGLGSFSYYDHVFLPESVKDLVWEHDGKCYRSQLVFRLNGKKKTEAYLHVKNGDQWMPVIAADGTVSDGKSDTYLRCVESILGSAETFFTSVFSAQGKRHLSKYKNSEIKTLLADLLGLEEIKEYGRQASETAKLLKTGLVATRQELAGLQVEVQRVARQRAQLGDTQAKVEATRQEKLKAQEALDLTKNDLAKIVATRDVAMQTEMRRSQLLAERESLIKDGKNVIANLDEQARREQERLTQLDQRIHQRAEMLRAKRRDLEQQRQRLHRTVATAALVNRAKRRLALADEVVNVRETRVAAFAKEVRRFEALLSNQQLVRQRLETIEREAGQAALKAEELSRRFGLTSEVPCAGTDLQGQCKLLGDAMEAKTLMPSATLHIARLAKDKNQAVEQLKRIQSELDDLQSVHLQRDQAEDKLKRARHRASAMAVSAARQGELEQAQEALMAVVAAINTIGDDSFEPSDDERAEQMAIVEIRQRIADQRTTQSQQYRASLDRIDSALKVLPPSFDESQIRNAEQNVARGKQMMDVAEEAFTAAIREQQTAIEAAQRSAFLQERVREVEARAKSVEEALGVWMLFAKCMGTDGVIALSIDEAGPTLAGLVNDLLLACYGPRFTVSIKTLVETAKGESREGFDIVVHDAETGESNSVTFMSGGEKVWINECLTRAIALYLAQNACRRYQTLFSDETDGALDEERKRMYLAMKREVLSLGGYDCEFYISQTPQLTTLADAVIDLDNMVWHDACRMELVDA